MGDSAGTLPAGLERQPDAGGSGSDAFAASRNTRWEGLQYDGWLTFEWSSRDRFLWAAVVADVAG